MPQVVSPAYSLHFPAEPVEVLPSFLLLLLILRNPLLLFLFPIPSIYKTFIFY